MWKKNEAQRKYDLARWKGLKSKAREADRTGLAISESDFYFM